jgi:DNA polymerase III alpha subunit
MITDNFGNIIYQENDILELLYQNKSEFLDQILVQDSTEILKFEKNANVRLKKLDNVLNQLSINEFDQICQQDWFLPDSYKNMDIEEFLVNVCPKENYQRLADELQEFKTRNMLPLLRVLKYLVDTFRENQVVWGVGRGSSVASYALFLIGIHKIDSVKYNLDWREFLR